MIRRTQIIPGNDCIYGDCCVEGCPGHRGLYHPQGHGIRGEHWLYIVRHGADCSTLTDGTGSALSLEVMTEIFPATVPRNHAARCGVICRVCGHWGHDAWTCEVNECDCPPLPLERRRRASTITFHRDVPPVDWLGVRQERCIALGGRPCWSESGYTAAEELFKRHGDPCDVLQSEKFWLAMEEALEGWNK